MDWPFVRSARPGGLLEALLRQLLLLSRGGEPEGLVFTTDVLRVVLDLFAHGDPPAGRHDLLTPTTTAAVTAARAIWLRDGLRQIPLAELARAAGVSVAHLGRTASRDLGRGVSGALDLVRLGVAAEQLQRTNRSVENIGRAAGYPWPYHFSRRFAAVYHAPPGRYRRTRRGDDPLAPLVAADLVPLWAALFPVGSVPREGARPG